MSAVNNENVVRYKVVTRKCVRAKGGTLIEVGPATRLVELSDRKRRTVAIANKGPLNGVEFILGDESGLKTTDLEVDG